MSAAEAYGLRHVDAPRLDGDATSSASRRRRPKHQLAIGCDLLQAIEELRSVPVLRWPDELSFDDNITSDVGELSAVTHTTASESDIVVQPRFTDHVNTTAMTEFAVASRQSCTARADDSNAGRPTVTVNGAVASPLPSLVDQHVVQTGACGRRSSAEPRGDGSERLSDSVFIDDQPTPIDAELLTDDVYEREMDELEQLDVDVVDLPDWTNVLPECNGFDQRNSADVRISGLLIESSTDKRLIDSREHTRECSFRSAVEVHRTDAHPQSGYHNTSYCSTVSSVVDTSAEELFEEIVESMTDTVSEDEYELDDPLIVDATNTTVGHEKLETTVCRRNIVDGALTSQAQPLTWPSNCLPRSSHKRDSLEQKRQKDLTVSLASTLNECLKALSRIDANIRRTSDVRRGTSSVERRRKYDTADSGDSGVVSSWSTTKTPRTDSEYCRCATSASSGFQSDIMDVDIDEEFDANAAYSDAADRAATRPKATESTSLDSLLDLNDDDDDDDEESYSTETIVRRPTALQSPRFDNHCTVDGFVGNTTATPRTAVKTETCATSADMTEDIITSELDQDDSTSNKYSSVVAYDDKSPKVEVLAEELITQEIVLNIVLPRRSKKNKKQRASVDGCVESVENSVVERKSSSDEAPHRDFHIHRIVRCSDADDDDDRPAISDRPLSQRLTSITETEELEAGNEDDERSGGRSLVARYVGGPLSVQMERNAESAEVERVDDDTSVRVTRRSRVKVLRAPAGSGGALYAAPVTGVGDVVDTVRQALFHRHHSLPSGVRVTCDAVERKSSTSLPVDDVTVVRRVIVDDTDRP